MIFQYSACFGCELVMNNKLAMSSKQRDPNPNDTNDNNSYY